MPFHAHISVDLGATMVLWHMTENSAELLQLLPEEERESLDAMDLLEKRLCEKATARLLLETMDETRDAQLGYTPEGAPYLLNRKGYISISHTRGWVAVAYHPTLPIGIDIERMGEKVSKVASRVLNESELGAYLDSPQRSAWLHLCWSAKEALFKAIPESGIDFREQLHIGLMESEVEGWLTATETRTAECRHYRVWYQVSDEFVLTCAVPITASL